MTLIINQLKRNIEEAEKALQNKSSMSPSEVKHWNKIIKRDTKKLNNF
jgi:hypothetical protein